jgi:hypothetical protein
MIFQITCHGNHACFQALQYAAKFKLEEYAIQTPKTI